MLYSFLQLSINWEEEEEDKKNLTKPQRRDINVWDNFVFQQRRWNSEEDIFFKKKNQKKIHLQQFSFVFEERLVLENQINPLKARSLSGWIQSNRSAQGIPTIEFDQDQSYVP